MRHDRFSEWDECLSFTLAVGIAKLTSRSTSKDPKVQSDCLGCTGHRRCYGVHLKLPWHLTVNCGLWPLRLYVELSTNIDIFYRPLAWADFIHVLEMLKTRVSLFHVIKKLLFFAIIKFSIKCTSWESTFQCICIWWKAVKLTCLSPNGPIFQHIFPIISYCYLLSV